MRFQSSAVRTALAFAGAALLFTGCGTQTKKCESTCPSVGATQCKGTQVQTCAKDIDDTCLTWAVAANCPTGQTCQGSACACAIPCGSACCSAGQACAGGVCCDNPCGSSCGCTSPMFCAIDGAGNKACASPCTTSGECQQGASDTPCCATQSGGMAGCVAEPPAGVHICLCSILSECSTNSCSPDTTMGLSGPYVCSPRDGSHLGGCGSAVGQQCTAPGDDCWQDNQANSFCTTSCTTSGDCPSGSSCDTLTCENLGKPCGADGGTQIGPGDQGQACGHS